MGGVVDEAGWREGQAPGPAWPPTKQLGIILSVTGKPLTGSEQGTSSVPL